MMTVRELRIGDLAAVTGLTSQLGYPATEDRMAVRIELLLGKAEETVLVVETAQGQVVGWLHIRMIPSLTAEPMGDICGLVVDQRHRSQGIGAQLVKAAELWMEARGTRTMRVRSNAVRKDAHRFYERSGFTVTKTSLTFEKKW